MHSSRGRPEGETGRGGEAAGMIRWIAAGLLAVVAIGAALWLGFGERVTASLEDRRLAGLTLEEALRELYGQTRAEVAGAVRDLPALLPRPPRPQAQHAAIARRLRRLGQRLDHLDITGERERTIRDGVRWAVTLYGEALREYALATTASGGAAEAHVSRSEELMWTAAGVVRGIGQEIGY